MITSTTTYTTMTCTHDGCGVDFALDDRFIVARRSDRATFYCPNGHPRWYPGKTVEQERDEAAARARHLEDQLQASERETEQHRRELVRQRSRFANGVCPVCNRSFEAVRRHMADQHPDFDPSHLHDGGFACACGSEFDTFLGLRTHQGLMINQPSSDTAQRRARKWHRTVVAS